MPPKTRNQSGGIDPDIVFPVMTSFVPASQLPTIKSVIGVLQSLTSGGAAKTNHNTAAREVAKLVYAKWYHDTVYTVNLQTVVQRVEAMWKKFREGRKRYRGGREDGKVMEDYKNLVSQADKLFDIGATTADQRSKCKEEWGVTMSDAEDRYFILLELY